MSTQIITRFAPSPTGQLHIGNARAALVNFLFAKKNNGKFILRMDDTDSSRSTEQFKKDIITDLKWLGIEFDEFFEQSSRKERYKQVMDHLIEAGRLYPCYETQEELELKRKFQLSQGKPPIYDRSALNISPEKRQQYEEQGRRPHYRFKILDEDISWNDLIKGNIKYHGKNLSDPVIVRNDGTLTYMLCSTIDDIDYNITHVMRGEDHVSNTAIQVQMFKALGGDAPEFGHMSLVKAKDEKISKRVGGYEISALRNNGIENMAINSFFSQIGTSMQMQAFRNINDLAEHFDISTYSKSPTTFMPGELDIINHKLLISLEYSEVKTRLDKKNNKIDEEFWLAVRPNLHKFEDIFQWYQICHNPQLVQSKDPELLNIAKECLPTEINSETWKIWTKEIANKTDKRGKDLFMPLRLALTGRDNGPELKALLPLLNREEIIRRLS